MKFRYALLPLAMLLSVPSVALAERGFQATDLVAMDR